MAGPEPDELLDLLERARDGESAAAQAVFVRVYDELRGLARSYLRAQAASHTLQPTALVHEAFLRMVRQKDGWRDRNHFVGVAATAMRQILVDHARRRGADKRGGGRARVTLTDATELAEQTGEAGIVDLLALDQALRRLAALSERQARVVELRCFGGLTVEEAADVLAISGSLAEKEWRRARAWVRRELAGDASPEGAP